MFHKFYASFDTSKFSDLLTKYSTDPGNMDRFQYCGEGTHFKCWKINHNNYDFAFKIALPEFLNRHSFKEQQRWAERVAKLSHLGLPHCLPTEMIRNGENLAIIMPFGQPSLPDSDFQTSFKKRLSDHQLAIDDQLQFVVIENEHYLCDISDLIILDR